MGVKFSQLPLLEPDQVTNEDYLAVLDSSEHILKKTPVDIPVPIEKGGTGNTVGYITTGHLSGISPGSKATAEGVATTALGVASHAEGCTTAAMSDGAHAEGTNTVASGPNSHAEGTNTEARGDSAHSSGSYSVADGDYSSASGLWTITNHEGEAAVGRYNESKTSGTNVHTLFTVGNGTAPNNRKNAFEVLDDGSATVKGSFTSTGNCNVNGNLYVDRGILIREGSRYTTMSPVKANPSDVATEDLTSIEINETVYSIPQGGSGMPGDPLPIGHGGTGNAYGYIRTGQLLGTVVGDKATIEGLDNKAEGDQSHAEGYKTQAIGFCSHAEGEECEAHEDNSHSEGYFTKALGKCAHSEGHQTIAEGNYSHAEGYGSLGSKTQAIGEASHAEGYETKAIGNYSHSEGYQCEADKDYSHAEGYGCSANGIASHAEGHECEADGNYSHAEGYSTNATGDYSHASGYNTYASGNYSFAAGKDVAAIHDCGFVFGNDGFTKFPSFANPPQGSSLALRYSGNTEDIITSSNQTKDVTEGYTGTTDNEFPYSNGYVNLKMPVRGAIYVLTVIQYSTNVPSSTTDVQGSGVFLISTPAFTSSSPYRGGLEYIHCISVKGTVHDYDVTNMSEGIKVMLSYKSQVSVIRIA